MAKSLEIERHSVFTEDIAGEIAFEIFTKGPGLTTRGLLVKEFINQGCLPEKARKYASGVTGSFALYRQVKTDAALYSELEALPIKLSLVPAKSNGSNEVEMIKLYYNLDKVTEVQAVETYIKELEAKREEDLKTDSKKKPSKKDRKKEKESVCSKALVVIEPFDYGLPMEILERKLKLLQEKYPDTRGVVLKDFWPKPEDSPDIPSSIMDRATSIFILDKGITEDELQKLIVQVRNHLVDFSKDVETGARSLVASVSERLEAILGKNPKDSLTMILPVKRQLVLSVTRLLQGGNQNNNLSFQKAPKNYYEPYLKEVVEKLAVEDSDRSELILSDDVIMKILLGDLLREIYFSSFALTTAEEELADYSIRCLVDRFSSVSEIRQLFLRLDQKAFDLETYTEDMKKISADILVLNEERKRLGSKTDPRSRQRREQIPSQIKDLGKRLDATKKLISEAFVLQKDAMPRNRIVKAVKSHIPREKPQQGQYRDQKTFIEDSDAYESFRFLSIDIQLAKRKKEQVTIFPQK